MKKDISDDDIDNMQEEEMISLIRRGILPQHVAIIMDGNGRWAKKKGLPRIAGHREGVKSVREIATLCRELNIPALTLYAFSMENWMRPKGEVSTLMRFLEQYLRKELNTLLKNEIRFKTIGKIERLPAGVKKWIDKVTEETEKNNKMVMTLALSYGGRTEIIDAVTDIINDISLNKMKKESLNEDMFSGYLYTKGLPDPDLLIRTSGETRVSNFLLWQIAYTELYFTKTLWPDFRRKDMLLAIMDFQQRQRRFGKVGEQIEGKN